MSDMSSQPNPQIYDLMSTPAPVAVERKPLMGGICGYNAKMFTCLITFIIILAIAWFFLYYARPDWVLKTDPVTGTKNIDNSKVLLWSLIFAFIVTIIIWMAQMGSV